MAEVHSPKRTKKVTILDAANVSASFRADVRQKSKELLETRGIKPLLVGLLANGDVAAKKYAEWTAKACNADGIAFDLRECEPNDLEDRLKEANQDDKVHGIMIYWPCFGAKPSFYGGSMDDYLRDSVAVEKDVEGLCVTYRRNLYQNVRTLPLLDGTPSDIKCLLPCTPLAIVKILEHLHVYDPKLPIGDRLKGKTVTVVNRSEIVGRPLAAMLANDGAEVFSVDIDSVYLMRRGHMVSPGAGFESMEPCVRSSDVVVLGVPSKNFKLDTSLLKSGVIVVNVSQFKNVDEIALGEVENATYVPLVGQVTVAMLERNLLRLIESFAGKNIKVVEAGGRIVRKL
jgi:methylenetetrahydrofolate dehydrogenase (NAD+)